MFQQFCDVTSLHGFKDYSDANNILWKSMWVCFIVTSFAVTCYEVYQVTSAYLQNPTATSVQFEAMNSYKFPNIALCPRNWINGSKLQNLTKSLSENALFYASSLINPLSIQMNQETLYQAQSEFYHYLNNTKQTVMEFYLNQMIDNDVAQFFSHGLIYTHYVGPPNVTSQLTGSGTFCFVYSFRQISHQLLLYSPFTFRLRYKEHELSSKDQELSSIFTNTTPRSIYPQLIPSKYEGATFTGYNIKLKPNFEYSITVEASYSSLLPKKNYCEDKQFQYSNKFCQMDCLENFAVRLNYADCCHILYSILATERKNISYSLCSSLNDTQRRLTSQSSFIFNSDLPAKCARQCLRSCKRWYYNYFVYGEPLPLNESRGETEINFFFNPSDGILYTQEISTYAWDTMISNIGGQLGLWMGGSVVSLVQVIYYVILCCTVKKVNETPVRAP